MPLKNKTAPVAEPVEHGIDHAIYTSNGVYYAPRLKCLCGFWTYKHTETWEDAGAELDEHLSEQKEPGDE